MAADKTPAADPKDATAAQSTAPSAPAADPKDMQGGAVVSQVPVKPIAPEVASGDDTVNIVTTAQGTFGPEGIASVGTKATVKISAFSEAWMAPASKADAEKIAAAKAAKAATPSA